MSICDNAGVPIDFYSLTYEHDAYSTITVEVFLCVPENAFTGQATVYVNVLSASSMHTGVALCPEKAYNVQIM